jgi:hypothetical protein
MSLPSFGHVLSMTDNIGMFEHADHAEPRQSHGYCTDDVARLLIAVVREGVADQALADLELLALRFLIDSQGADGRTRNRRDIAGRWHGRREVGDCWGRSAWAFGTAAVRASDEGLRSTALSHFGHAVNPRSPYPRAMAFAALGAAEVLGAGLRHDRARDLLTDLITCVGAASNDRHWPWPEPRLEYANAVLPEALIASGHLLERPEVVDRGLSLLRWLLDRETLGGHLSPTPVGGAGRDDRPPRFDQQPIEVAAMADACMRAHSVTGDDAWLDGVALAIGWFAGDNDGGHVMWDADTGGGYDGLTPTGPNVNQGAESTLALITTMQHHAAVTLRRPVSPAVA